MFFKIGGCFQITGTTKKNKEIFVQTEEKKA